MAEPKKPNKEKAYEELLKAMSEGEFGMTKYIWQYISKIEDAIDVVPTFQKKIDDFIKEYKIKDGKDGATGAQGPVGATGPKGEKGDSIAGPQGPAGTDGLDGTDGVHGKDGEQGRAPAHEWDGTKIRFQNSDGSWGEWTDLRGPTGSTGQSYGPGEGMGGGLERILAIGGFERQGATEILFGDNLIVTRTGNGVRVDAQAGGTASGVSFITEELTPTQVGNDITLDLTQLSQTYVAIQFVTRQGQILAESGWSKTSDTITVFNAAADEVFSVQVTYSASSGINVLTEELTPSTSGLNITLDLTQLSETYIAVQFVSRNGQILASTSWSKTGDTITVLDSSTDDQFTVQVTFL